MSTETPVSAKSWFGIHWVVWGLLGAAATLLVIEHLTHRLALALPFALFPVSERNGS